MYGIDTKIKVIKTKYDTLGERYLKIELGFVKNTITTLLKDASKQIDDANNKIDDNKKDADSKIDDAKADADKKVSDLTVTMEKSDSDILDEVKNNKTNIDTKIQLMDGEIDERVTKDEYGSFKTQTLESISQSVTKEGFSTELTENAEAIGIAIHGLTNMNVTFDSFGQTIENGAFRIVNKNGQTVMWINPSGVVMLHDLYFDNAAFESDSNFASSLANMKRLSLSNVSISGKLTIDEHDFYLYKDGDGGYDLKEYVNRRIKEYCDAQGW